MYPSRLCPPILLSLTWLGCALALSLGFSAVWISLLLLGILGVVNIQAFLLQSQTTKGQESSVVEAPAPSSDIEDSYARASFLAKVTHELRTPLHNILGLLNIVYKNDNNATNRYYLRLIQDTSFSLLGTINDVLDYSKSDTGMLTVECRPMDLADTVRQALRTVSPRVADKVDLELLCSCELDVPSHVRSDSVRIRQVLVNLLGNAIKFTTTGEVRLKVSVDRETNDGWTLRFCVSDTGIGIPASKIHSIFDPFNQVDMTVVRRAQGTGLGLTIVRQLVTALSGEVSVTSTLGKGSEFTVTLPVKRDSTHDEPKLSLAGNGVLCIFCNSSSLSELLVHELSKFGAETFSTKFPLSFMEIAARNVKHLIVSDSVLTEASSWTMIQDFIEQRGPNNLIVLLTPAAIHFRERCSQLGANNLLTLPVLSRDIVSSLNGFCPENPPGADLSARVLRAKEPLNILIADDMATNQLILRTILEEAGHKVRAVNDGEELFELIRHQVENVSVVTEGELFDVILTDIQMPKMDGITVIRRTRELERKCSADPLPLIAITAHAFQAELNRILNAGATGIVTKPLNLRELEDLINSVSRRSKRLSEDSVVAEPSTMPNVVATASRQYDSFVAAAEKTVSEVAITLGTPITLNIADVFERSGNSVRRTLLICRAFVSGYREILDALHYKEGESGAEELGKVAHSLKGLLAEVGATTAQGLAAKVEEFGREGDLTRLLPLLDTLRSETLLAAAGVGAVVQAYDQKRESNQGKAQSKEVMSDLVS